MLLMIDDSKKSIQNLFKNFREKVGGKQRQKRLRGKPLSLLSFWKNQQIHLVAGLLVVLRYMEALHPLVETQSFPGADDAWSPTRSQRESPREQAHSTSGQQN